MSDLVGWLERRGGAPSAALRRSLAETATTHDPGPGPIHDRLAAAGLAALEAVAHGPEDRSVALMLLTADALLTYACEAAAEAGPEALHALTDRLGPDRFEAILEGVEP